MPADLIDEHIAAIEATLPHDLTKINAGSAPLGLEALVVQSLSAAPAEQGSFGVRRGETAKRCPARAFKRACRRASP